MRIGAGATTSTICVIELRSMKKAFVPNKEKATGNAIKIFSYL